MEPYIIALLENLRQAPPFIKLLAASVLLGISGLVIWNALGHNGTNRTVRTPAEVHRSRVLTPRTGDSAVDGARQRLSDADDSESGQIQVLVPLFRQEHLLNPAEQRVEVVLFRLFHAGLLVSASAEHPRLSPDVRRIVRALGGVLNDMQSLVAGLFPRTFSLQLHGIKFGNDLEAFIEQLPPQRRHHREQSFSEPYRRLLGDVDRLLRELDLR